MKQENTYRLKYKRWFDLAGVLVVSFLVFPLVGLIVLMHLMIHPGALFFCQERIGKDGQPFTLFKFRTMTLDGQRTNWGTMMRKLSIDELPQLFNVWKGEMSLIGPRPLLKEYLPLYNEYHQGRHLVLPGITGLAQVKGRNAISWVEKFDLDLEYVQNLSFLLDIKILFLTLLVMFDFRKADFEDQGQDFFKGY